MDDVECPDCLGHEAGICFRCKMEHWRSTGGLGVVKAAPSAREETEKEFQMAASRGRRLEYKEQ